MATASPLIASNPDGNVSLEKCIIPKATSLPHIASILKEENHLQRNTSKCTTPPISPDATNWDDIDPVTGLSREYMIAMDIIDSCGYAELRRFNAPLLANQTMSIGQQIEMYYNGGESKEYRHKRKERMMGRRRSVTERVEAIVAFWGEASFGESREMSMKGPL